MYQYTEDFATMGFVLNKELTQKLFELSNFYEKTPYEVVEDLIELTHKLCTVKDR